jgi:probable rRNA maturation factor
LQKNLRAIITRLPARDRHRLAAFDAVTVVMVGAAEGRKLNRSFRRRDRPTDVMSFAPVETNSLGELVFCRPVVTRQAKEHRLGYRNELLYLFIHGVLHLLGYDHEKSDKAARVMYRLQDRIFEELCE